MDAKPTTMLAIDSSTDQAGVGLYDGVRLAELSWIAGRTQTASLLGQIHHLLTLHELAVGDLSAIAVAIGPGTFSGLRVGISVAKGLVLGLGVPLLGVPTLAAAALPFAAAGRPVVAVVTAGRERLVWAEYRDGVPGWVERVAPRNGTAADLAEDLTSRGAVLVTGEFTPRQEAAIAEIRTVTLVPGPLRPRRPGAVAALGWARFRGGDVDDPVAVEPVYLGR